MLICFDMDGVLVDACELHKVSLELAMQEELGYTISDEDHYSKFNGLPTKKKLEILGLSKEKIEIINNKKQEYTLNLIEKCIHLDQQKIDLLDYLKKSGYLLACVTNSVEKTTHIMLKKTGIFDYFDLIVTNESVKNPKPSPEPYLFAMDKLNSTPENTIIIEDSNTGIKSAKASNASVIIVKNPTEVTLENLKNKI
jgi:HAD superfamily hydrolase (TIGR01509 family)